MNYETKILKGNKKNKEFIKKVSKEYQEDFLLDNVVFCSLDSLKELESILPDIEIKNEGLALQ